MRRVALFVLAISAASFGQQAGSRPSFNNYAVAQVFRGRPAAPRPTGDQRMFRTMIRHGADADVQFAGHFTVPRWGCGTLCNAFVVVDSITGRVYDGFVVSELPPEWEGRQNGNVPERMEFHPGSRLMKINGCINERDCGFYDYVMEDGKGLKLVRKELLPKDFQP